MEGKAEEKPEEEPMDDSEPIPIGGGGADTLIGGVEGDMSTDEESPPLGTQSSQGSAGTEHRAAFLREIF